DRHDSGYATPVFAGRVMAIVRVIAIVGVSSSFLTGAATSVHAVPSVGPGCDARRPALAHYPGGPPLRPQPANAPIPCGVLTGFGGAEVRIAVDRSGTVFFNPAVADPGPTNCVGRCAHSGLAITNDAGASWSFAESPSGSRVDNALAADPNSSRVFWIPFSDGSPTLDVRVPDDGGATWRDASACCGSAENPHVVFAGSVTYVCSNT